MNKDNPAVFASTFIPAEGEENYIPVEKLELGMYVSDLDIPWNDSPFLLQGFKITTNEEIQKIQKICQFVKIKP